MRSVYYKLILFIFALLCSGCSTILSRKEYILVHSDPPRQKVSLNKTDLGTTPFIAHLPRQRKRLFILQNTPVLQKADYRWYDSFLKNLVFSTYAPVGWATDLITHAAWQSERVLMLSEEHNEAQNDNSIMSAKVESSAQSFSQHVKAFSAEKLTIAILPPLANTPEISDEVALVIKKEISRLYPGYTIYDYKKTALLFEKLGARHDSPLDAENLNEAFFKTDSSILIRSSTEWFGDYLKVSLTYEHVFNSTEEVQILGLKNIDSLLIEKSALPSAKKELWSNQTSSFFKILPNAVAINFADTTPRISINDIEYELEPAKDNGWLGSATQFVSAISLRRLPDLTTRQHWLFHFEFTPIINLAITKSLFPKKIQDSQLSTIQGLETRLYHIDIGYGPTLSYFNRSVYLYAQIYIGLAFERLEAESKTIDFSSEDFFTNISSEFGVLYEWNKKYHIKLFTQNVSSSEKLWARLVQNSTASNNLTSLPEYSRAGLSVGYRIPNTFY